jgi:two-component system, OmpR family, sensor kinase
MSLRLRLALTYGLLAGFVVLLVSLIAYSVHSRGTYDDLDSSLVSAAVHVAAEHSKDSSGAALTAALATPLTPDIVERVYSQADQLLASSPNAAGAPQISPNHALHHPFGTAFDPLVGLAPALKVVDPGNGAFSVLSLSDGTRWRAYVLPDSSEGRYFVSMASLDRIDASVERLRWLMVLLTVFGAVVNFSGGALVAGRALKPVATLTETANAIALSRSFNRRVSPVNRRDELGRLASTVNEMLDSLEEAYRSQQRFVADASHELRAPLTAIQANLELLERQSDMSPAERKEALREADREAARLARLVADLLALARADAGVPLRRQPLELDRVLLDALGEARHLTKGQTIEVGGIEPVELFGDSDRLKQLILILIDNALKYTPSSGKITASMRRVGERAQIVVQDNGVGISASDLPHVFERFYRADPARGHDPGGTGLGLPIAKWIAEQHRGSISISSEPGEGTTVIISLPITGPQAFQDLA